MYFIRSTVATAILNIEIANFTKGSFKFVPQEAVRTALTKISSSITKKLYKYNMLLATTDKGESVAVFYKGEAIITGTEKEVKEALENIFTHARADKDIIMHLDELLDITNFIRKYSASLKTLPDEAFFWSGRTDGIGGQHIALEIAISKEGITLEGIISKKSIPMPAWENNQKIWEAVSKKYAEQVSGHIRAVVGNSLRKGNIWEKFELPALKKNKNVKSITVIDPKTRSEKIIFKTK